MLKDLVLRNRSTRRFRQDQPISEDSLRELVDLARLTPSGANLQPLRYLLCTTPAINAQVFPHLGWAGYLKDWPGPAEGERPAAYILIVQDTEIARTGGTDHGIAAQTMLLGAVEKGLNGCMIGVIAKQKLRKLFQLPPSMEVMLVLALGVGAEEIVLEQVGSDNSIQYWRDENQVHHVPKRDLDDLILPNPLS